MTLRSLVLLPDAFSIWFTADFMGLLSVSWSTHRSSSSSRGLPSMLQSAHLPLHMASCTAAWLWSGRDAMWLMAHSMASWVRAGKERPEARTAAQATGDAARNGGHVAHSCQPVQPSTVC